MPEKNRILTFDILRGYFLFVIIIDHLLRTFGFWEILTGRGAQWVSAAEGFFFVSGIMIGMVRGRKMNSEPIKNIFKKCWSRALTLYLWSIGLTVLFSLLALHFEGNPSLKGGYFMGSLHDFMIKTATLYFSYGWADFLSFYAVYLFFSPFAIWLMRRKLWQVVLALSLLAWINTATMMGGWQIIFFSGLVCGFYREEIERFFLGLSSTVKKILVTAVYITTGVTLALSVFFTTFAEEYGKPGSSGKFLTFDVRGARDYSVEILRPHFDKVPMEPMRLALFFIWFVALFLLARKFERRVKKYLGWFLITLGQNSLYVYILSSFFLFFNYIVIPGGQPWYINTLISTGVLGLVWYATKKRFLFRIIPR